MDRQSPSRPVIGVTGGIGSGKSLVCRMLADLGCTRIDADRVGHELLARPEIVAALRRRFGEDIVRSDGRVDRARLGARAFADERCVAELNAIMHPPLRQELVRRIEAFRASRAAAAVLDAALLFETDWHTLCDATVFVEADRERRITRVLTDRNWTAERFAEREKYQKPLDNKRAEAQYVLENNSSVSHLQQQVRQLYQRIVGPECSH